jgi:hypothetical protein
VIKKVDSPLGGLEELIAASGAVQRGIEDGAHNLPPATAPAPAESEGAIRHLFLEQGNVIISVFREKLVRPLAEATALIPAVIGDAIVRMPQAVDQRIADMITWHEDALTSVAIDAAALQRTARGIGIAINGIKPVDAFARRHDLVLLAGTVLAESALNSWAFSVGSSMGMLGGGAQSLGISITNVLGAYTWGRVCRAIQVHGSQMAKNTAYGAFLLGGALLTFYHVTIAAYRDLLLRAPHPEHAGEAVFRFLANEGPGRIADFSSWMLAAIGLGFGGWAVLAGWRHIDVRAKAAAGRALRAAAKAKAAWDARKGVLLSSVGTIHDDAEEHIVALVAGAHEALSSLYILVRMMEADTADLATQLTRLNEAYVLAIKKYRTTNIRVRSAPVPRYFAAAPEPLAFGQLSDQKISALAEVADDGISPLAKIEKQADEARREIELARPVHTAAVQALINRINRLAAGHDALREMTASIPVGAFPLPQLRPS